MCCYYTLQNALLGESHTVLGELTEYSVPGAQFL